MCFFFQAEDGIRDPNVTGVQTCALPICDHDEDDAEERPGVPEVDLDRDVEDLAARERPKLRRRAGLRSEERRVGKECRAAGGGCQYKNDDQATKQSLLATALVL